MIAVVNTNPAATTRSGTQSIVRRLRSLTPPGTAIVERHFRRVDLSTLQPCAVVLGPQGVPFQAYREDLREHLFGLIRSLECPVLGICGGHQALALAHGGTIAPVFEEGLPKDGSYGTLRKMRGFGPVQYAHHDANRDDPLLHQLPNPGQFFSSHVEAIQHVPTGFSVLATGAHNTIQVVRRDGTPQYGVQFHPERGGAGHQLLRNFLQLAQMPIQ